MSQLGATGEGFRFNELQRSLGLISPKSLSDRLKELTEKNLVNRYIENSVYLRSPIP
ncbi:MAG: helix-turn-helix transcriptional regulator [Candidatus Thermoplasmatota archaeon]|nr:helix-turn-helix transcriptional regulator [Candidatus Thermoplasmatota archaeon]